MTRPPSDEDDASVLRSLLAGDYSHALVNLTATACALGIPYEVVVTPEGFAALEAAGTPEGVSAAEALLLSLHAQMTNGSKEHVVFAVPATSGSIWFSARSQGPRGPWLLNRVVPR